MDRDKENKLKDLLKAEIKLRFGKSTNNKSKKSPEEKKKILLEYFEEKFFVESIVNGEESPSKVSDFKTRNFHGRLNLFD